MRRLTKQDCIFAWVISIIVLLVLDAVWIWLYMGKTYKVLVKNIQGSEMRVSITASIFAYVMLACSLLLLLMNCIDQVANTYMILRQSLYAGVWGCIIYGTYAFTNAAIFYPKFSLTKHVPWEMIWGFILYGLSTMIGLFIVSTYTK